MLLINIQALQKMHFVSVSVEHQYLYRTIRSHCIVLECKWLLSHAYNTLNNTAKKRPKQRRKKFSMIRKFQKQQVKRRHD